MRRRARITKATHILTFEEFTRTPRTAQEIESYHVILGNLQRMGMVDDQLQIVGSPK